MYHTISIGRNIERIRKLKGIKQETLAALLGISRQSVSKLEQSERIDDARLEQIALVLGVSIHVIKNVNEDLITTAIPPVDFNYGFNFNPWNKIIELYDALLLCQQEKINLLKAMVKDK